MTDSNDSLNFQDDPDRQPFTLTQEELLNLVKTVDSVTPIDFAGLPIDEEAYFKVVTNNVMNMLAQMQADSPRNWTLTLITSLIQTIAENGVLQARLLQNSGSEAEMDALLKRLSGKN